MFYPAQTKDLFCDAPTYCLFETFRNIYPLILNAKAAIFQLVSYRRLE